MKDGLLMLRLARLTYQLERARERRDALALEAIERGHTWREVAAAAGFANPYLAHLKRVWGAPVGAHLSARAEERQQA